MASSSHESGSLGEQFCIRSRNLKEQSMELGHRSSSGLIGCCGVFSTLEVAVVHLHHFTVHKDIKYL